MIPTTAALIPLRALYIPVYFFRLFHTGKKNNTSRALGKKMEIAPIMQPVICIFFPSFSKVSPPVKAAMEKTGPGIALTIPAPVKKYETDPAVQENNKESF